METVQQSVVHLEHSGMPSQAQMAYAQRTTALHSRATTNHPQPGEGSPYKPQRPPAAPPSPANYANYPPTHNSMRYVQQQSPYGTAVPYRDNPYTVPTPQTVVNERQQAVEFVRSDNMAPQVRPRISLLTNMPTTPEYLPPMSRNRIQPGEQYRERERIIDLVTPAPSASSYHLRVRDLESMTLTTMDRLVRGEQYRDRERERERERERDRDCVVVPSTQTSTMQDLGPSVKKIRLGEPKPELQQQLRIETRQEPAPAYNPQVEAISPTGPSDNVVEDANFRSTKDDLLQQISKVDREISKTESAILKLKKKEQELAEAACQPDEKKDEEEDRSQQPKHQSLAQKIYAENRRKAQKAHLEMEKLGPKVDLPLYNQPSDTAVYHENKRRHAAFRKRLLDHLRTTKEEKETREKNLTQTYSRMMQEWHRKIEKIENSAKRKAKDAKNREFFEKVFPELRKQREDRERFNRVGNRIKSEADLEEIMDGLQEQEMEDKKMKSYAVVPPLLFDARQRRYGYIDNNGKIEDLAAEYKEHQLSNVWTKEEKEIFKEKFLQHPKNFGVIASYLDRKSACDCVQYYYHSKKEENYKRLLRKSRQRTRSSRNPHGKVNNASGAGASTSGAPNDPMDSILSSATGVTTRLQREQLQKQEHPPAPLPPPAPSETPSITPNPICDTVETKDNNPSPTPPLLTVAVTPPLTISLNKTCASAPPELTTAASEIKLDNKKKERRKEDKKKKEEELGETTDEELHDPQDAEKGPQLCVVCKTESEMTRALPRSHASQYGLREEDIAPGARVCNTCRCKAVRSRYTHCPLPTCPNAKGHRVKRLRPLPMKWPELPRHIRDPIAAEFQIPPNVSKCCSACFNRISRKLTPVDESGAGGGGSSGSSPGPLQRWSEEEIEALKKGLREHGNRWSEVSQVVGPSKSHHQCKNFFFNYKKKFGLDQILQEYNKTHLGEERKPSLTDEEESGSSTSSCDEMSGMALLADSDTASAGSPSHAHAHGEMKEEGRKKEETKDEGATANSEPPTLTAHKEDYDSSATETADEGQGAGEMEGRSQAPPTTASSPLTVKDIMLGVIEMQLMKNQAAAGGSGPAPTISSILKTDHSFVKSGSLATLSVVAPQELAKDSLVVVQQPLNRDRETEGTLDLSIKKPRTDYREAKPSPLAPPHSVTVYRTASTHTDSNYYHQVASPQLQSKLSPKLSPGLLGVGGSILHGTPVSSPSIYTSSGPQQASTRYDSSPLLRQMTPPHATKEASTGSITQGTPVHQRGIYPGSTSSEYYSSSGTKRPTPTAQGFYSPRPPAYAVEQRQIIMNDYITSQQMHGSAARRTNDKTTLYYPPRQGVIQRHNTKPPSPHHYPAGHKPPSPHHYPPGHEAFSSLVDVAVRQPSLPVPHPDHKEDKRLLHEGLGERFNRENTQDRFANRDQERFSRENHQIQHRQIPENHHQQHQSQAHPTSMHQPLHHHREMERERSHIQQQHGATHIREHQLQQQLREQQLHHQHQQMQQQQMQQQHQRDLLHQKQQQQQQHQNHLQSLEHHRLSRMSGSGYPPPPQQNQESSRMMQLPPPPPPRQHPDNSGGREGSGTPTVSVSGSSGTSSRSSTARGSDSSTLTAASLIDAIITHQINQPSSDGQVASGAAGTNAPAPPRPGDRLFQGFHREGPEANGKLSPLKSGGLSMAGSPDPKQGSITLGEHIESIINKDYPPTSRHAQFQAYEPQAWKLRRALQQKELDQNQSLREKNDERNIVRMAGPPSPSSRVRYYEPPAVPISPLDYVKNRIVEVMRTSEEEGGSKSGGGESPGGGEMVIDEGEDQQTSRTTTSQAPAPFIATSAAYTYPFSALSLNAAAPSVPVSVANMTAKQPTDSVPEPAPLLSAQYEPLSDED
ncbi:uncharacterized protein LOC128999132 isoform X3 [Macrosteles quadrilineatus]|uniref:uncharacterized protein LOC128999132 isoform X3 n=1 Tax=Macrosteles quadrilineatus TaxID=74068 RepID=UPI0023E0A31C|nr:uncharacterized protein LOC128999132 isoform X3 [Macrosteles quadrilineatus]